MPIIGTPIPTPATDAYLAAAEARVIAATLAVGLPADDDACDAALLLASIDIDAALYYQGRRYDAAQTREFPRIDGAAACPCPLSPIPSNVWDWDADSNTAVVPGDVKRACVLQAAWAASGVQAEMIQRLEAIRSGLRSQQIGSGQEQYAEASDGSVLCDRALRIMQGYQLRSGEIL